MSLSKKERKVGKVMGEFKSGTLKSGGSGKKVTNPKQAIAIALSEANAMNQGGMMQNPVMQRPMFQNPMQRQGLGIMAGVAPIRGYEEGGEVEDELSFMDYVRFAPEIPGMLGDAIVGEDETMGDFFSLEKTPEGQGMNLRDLTDIFIVDPDDPVDVGIATATAGLMASGVGAPGAIAAQLGRMGYKGKKVADVIEKVIRTGVGETRGKTFGRGQTARLLASAPDVFAGEEEVEEETEQGIGLLPQVTQNKPQRKRGSGVESTQRNIERGENEGIASIPDKEEKRFDVGVSKGGVPFKESFAHHRAKGDDVFTWNGELYTTDLAKEPVGMNKGGKVGLAGLLSGLKDKTIAKLKGKKAKGQADDVVDDVKVVDEVADMPSPTRTARILKMLGSAGLATGALTGGVLGASALIDDDEADSSEVASAKEKEDAATAAAAQQVAAQQAAAAAAAKEEEKPGGVRGFLGSLMDRMSDPRVQYQLAKAGQASEGIVPRNFGSDVVLAGAEFDQLQSKLDAAKPELVQQYEAIRPYAEQGENETAEDVDRRVFKSLFDRMDAATQLEALLTLYKSVPDAISNLESFEEFAKNLGLSSVSDLLTKRADTQ